MVRKLRKMAEKNMESLVSTLARRNEDRAQVLGINNHLRGEINIILRV